MLKWDWGICSFSLSDENIKRAGGLLNDGDELKDYLGGRIASNEPRIGATEERKSSVHFTTKVLLIVVWYKHIEPRNENED